MGVRKFYSAAGGSSTVLTDGLRKIRKRQDLCLSDKDFIVTDKLYNILYDKEMSFMAFNKLKSPAVNMTPGITLTTLDGMSMEVIEEIIQSLKDGTFKALA